MGFTKGENVKDKLVGVVVTIFEGSSYDEMFREVRPQTVAGERGSTYSLCCRDVKLLNEYLSAIVPIPEDQLMWRSLVNDINQVQADSVTFNWECCSACGDRCFPCMEDGDSDVGSLPSVQNQAYVGSVPSVQTQETWCCTACTLVNEASAPMCAACDAVRPVTQDSTQNSSQTFWSCAVCTLQNDVSAPRCMA